MIVCLYDKTLCKEMIIINNKAIHKGIILLKYNKTKKRVNNSACPEGIPAQLNPFTLLLRLHFKEGLILISLLKYS
jgi:hypothetical protein